MVKRIINCDSCGIEITEGVITLERYAQHIVLSGVGPQEKDIKRKPPIVILDICGSACAIKKVSEFLGDTNGNRKDTPQADPK